MKKSQFSLLSIVLGCFLVGSLSYAGPRQRQQRQVHRIKQGVRAHSVTRGEFRNLARGQKRVQRAMRRAKRDGEVTRKERRRIRRMQKRQNRRIHRAKHNRNSPQIEDNSTNDVISE